MSGITSGVGLFSGIDSGSIIEQLLQIEARPRALAQRQVVTIKSKRAAVLDINSSLLALKKAAGAIRSKKLFNSASATSSNPDSLTATASSGAKPGSYRFLVNRLASTHQSVSRGFASNTSGAGATSLTFEFGGQLSTETNLSDLNSGAGVRRGSVRIAESGGKSTVVDLSRAVTVTDVVDALNGAGGLAVKARIEGESIVLEHTGTGTLTVNEVNDGSTAADLGILQTTGAKKVSGSSVYKAGSRTALSLLNDGAGVSFNRSQLKANAVADLVLSVDGSNYNISLGELLKAGEKKGEKPTTLEPAVSTLGDVVKRINALVKEQKGDKDGLTASINADGRLVLTGENGKAVEVKRGTTGRDTASDLGILTDNTDGDAVATSGNVVTSRRLLASINSTLSRNLNGGAGVSAGTFRVTAKDGSAFDVTLTDGESTSTILQKFNDAASAAGVSVGVAINASGNGLTVTDKTSGSGSLKIADQSGTAAADLKLATSGDADGVVDSGNLQSRYIGAGTLLSSLRGGAGIGIGKFEITTSTGAKRSISIDKDDLTIADVLKKLNNVNGVNARLNDTGDGIVVEDTAGGGVALRIEDTSGTVAKSLRIAGKSAKTAAGSNLIVGSQEVTVDIDAGDTLAEIAKKVNNAGVGVRSAVLNDGAGASPFRLAFTSESSGVAGGFTIDSTGIDFESRTLSEGSDAVVFYGSNDPASALLIHSPTNTLKGAIPGVDVTLKGTASSPITVTVGRDTSALEEGITAFVESFNKVIERTDFHTRFKAETKERGALFGENTPNTVRSRLYSMVQGTGIGITGQFSRLFEVGIRVGKDAKVVFDADRFRKALETDPGDVEELLSGFAGSSTGEKKDVLDADNKVVAQVRVQSSTDFSKLGVFERFSKLADDLTNSSDGVLTRRNKAFDRQIKVQERRIEEFGVQLEQKRGRLSAKFLAMERAIASLQSQQASLSRLGR